MLYTIHHWCQINIRAWQALGHNVISLGGLMIKNWGLVRPVASLLQRAVWSHLKVLYIIVISKNQFELHWSTFCSMNNTTIWPFFWSLSQFTAIGIPQTPLATGLPHLVIQLQFKKYYNSYCSGFPSHMLLVWQSTNINWFIISYANNCHCK